MYASSAEALTAASTPGKRDTTLKEFRQKMVDRIPTYAEFEANFHEIVFVSSNTRDKALVQYLLQRLDVYGRSGSSPESCVEAEGAPRSRPHAA